MLFRELVFIIKICVINYFLWLIFCIWCYGNFNNFIFRINLIILLNLKKYWFLLNVCNKWKKICSKVSNSDEVNFGEGVGDLEIFVVEW